MLERLAEMVREDAKEANNNYGLMPCMACDGRPAESERCLDLGPPCPEMQNPDGSLMLARWAVLLVARALEKWVSEIDRTNGVDLGDVEALGSEFMDLYYEVKKAEAKELNIGKVDG